MPAPPVHAPTPPEEAQTGLVECPSPPGAVSPKRRDEPDETRSIPPPADGSPPALDRGSGPAPSASAGPHMPPVRPSSPSQPTMPLSHPDSTPPTPLRPSALLPLLRCAFCRLLLDAPTTLNCGHTVCSKHMGPDHLPSRTRRPAASTAHSAHPPTSGPAPTHSPVISAPPDSSHHPRVLACPVDGCTPRQPARVQVLGRTSELDAHGSGNRGVRFSPADHQPHADAVSGLRHPLRGPVVRLDVTISKLLELVTTSARAQATRARDSSTQHPHDSEAEAEDEEDSDAEDEESPVRYPRPPRSSATDRGSSGTPVEPSNPDRALSVTPTRPSKRQRTDAPVQTATGIPDRSSCTATFEKELLTELTCEICYMLLYNPITTPCQHTFCNTCLERSLDHSPQCPLCRLDLPPNSYFYQHAHNQVVVQIVAKAFPELLQERIAIAENDGRDSRLDTAIFVCQLSYPGMPTLLHFFEPRYRLMLRRCLASPTPRFGIVMPRQSANNTEGNDYGTMLEIRSVQMLSDGRSMVETFGTFRFRILERGTLDGYLVGRIERIDDYPPEVEAEIERNAMSNPTDSDLSMRVVERSNQELVDICRRFIDQLRNGTAPWVVQRLNNTYGPMPSDISSFSFWVALVLPIDEQEKAKLLPIRSARLRLRLVVHWIEQLNNNWWFSSGIWGILQLFRR